MIKHALLGFLLACALVACAGAGGGKEKRQEIPPAVSGGGTGTTETIPVMDPPTVILDEPDGITWIGALALATIAVIGYFGQGGPKGPKVA